jgi:hypothetical protein
MRAKTSRWCISIGLAVLALMTTLSSNVLGQYDKGKVYFKKNVNLLHGLQDGSRITKPGEYTLKIQMEGGQPVLTVQSKEGDPLLRSRGEQDAVPENERDFKSGGRLKILAVPDTKRPGGHWIVFLYDFVDSKVGKYVRFRFRIAEAT